MIRYTHASHAHLLLLLGTALATNAAQAQDVEYRILGRSGDPVPGVQGAVFDSIGAAAINEAGQVLLGGSVLSIDGVSSDFGFWLAHPDGSIDLVAIENGVQALPTGFVVMGQPYSAKLDDAGRVVFLTDGPSAAMWLFDPASGITRLVDPNNPPQDAGPTDFIRLIRIAAFNETGTALLEAMRVFDQVSVGGGYYLIDTDGTTDLAFNPGQQISSDPIELLGSFTTRTVSLTDDDTVIFTSRVNTYNAQGNITEIGDAAWRVPRGGPLEAIARDAQPVPGMNSTVQFGGFSDAATNNAGDVALHVWLEDAATAQPNNLSGIWQADPDGPLGLVTRRNLTPPGIGGGVQFDGFSNLTMNGAGRIAFAASLRNGDVTLSTDAGVWLDPDGNGPRLIAREGDPVVGLPGSFFKINPLLFLSDAGHLLIHAATRPEGAGFWDPDVPGVWLTDSNGQLRLIASVGQPLDFDPDPAAEDLRTVETINLPDRSNGSQTGRNETINSAGQALVSVRFAGPQYAAMIATIVDPECLADINGNGVTDPGDFSAWVSAYNANDPAADQNGNGAVEPGDFAAWITNYNAGCL